MVGVSPKNGKERTYGEVDIGESINTSFSKAISISGFQLGLLFDGPEYNDINEKAQITATYFDDSVKSYVFTATDATAGLWTGSGSFENTSSAVYAKGAAWSFNDKPFGDAPIKSLSLIALPGVCGSAGGACTNQSDFTLISISAAPETETYATFLAGLGLMGFVARRCKSV